MQPPSLLYLYDPLCGWCYGFSPVMQRLHADFAGRLHFEVLSGGMVTGDRAGPIGQVAPYIKRAYKDVENRTGVRFGEAFLDNVLEPGTAVFSSEKPCTALTVFKSRQPENAVAFAHALQHALYHDGRDLTADDTYADLAVQHGIHPDKFVEELESLEFKRKTEQEFRLVARMGVSGFPTVLLLTEGQPYVLARGYSDYEPLRQAIERLAG